jgi:hypothetical protein
MGRMTVRTAALVVMLTLVAPPLVGIACGVWCEAGHGGHGTVASHDHVPTGHRHHAAPAGVSLVGEHVCDHGLGLVDVYGPSNGPRTPVPAVAFVTGVPADDVLALAVLPWGHVLERAVGPPTRSPVLRI